MSHVIRGFLVAMGSTLFLFGGAHSHSRPAPLGVPGQLPLHLFTEKGLPEEAIGLSVAVLNTRESPDPVRWLGHRSEQAMNPASTVKLITTRAAWSILGPDYRHRTQFLTTGRLAAGRLRGPLYLRGGGDPKLVVEDIEAIVLSLRSAGVRHIEGDLILDATRFAEPIADPNAFDGMGYKPYNVTPYAAMLNFKAVRVRVTTTAAGKLRGEIDPALSGLRLRLALKRVRGGCSRNQVQLISKPNIIEATGRMGRACSTFESYLAVYDHDQFAHRLFSATWRAAGGRFVGKVRSGRTPDHARLLLDWVSPRPLHELVADINKLSNNPMARTLFLNVSAEAGGPGTRADAQERVKSWLLTQNLHFPEMVLDNGSGLSRLDRIAPKNLTRLLVQAMRGPGAQEWLDTLPAAGLEGTLRRRLKDGAVTGRAWVKTGTLEGVRAYPGYVRTETGHLVAFSAIINHPNAVVGGPSLEAFVKWLVETL